MGADLNFVDISQVIQLAVAPVFMLTAVGTIIGVLSNRLGRIVDRTRKLDERLNLLAGEDLLCVQEELELLGRRVHLVYLAIACAVFCALFVGLLIALAFVDAFLSVELARVIGALFVLAMLAFIASLVLFLREIFLAVTSHRSIIR